VTDAVDALAGLPRGVRDRLDALSNAVDLVGLDLLPTFIGGEGPERDRAFANAELVAIESGREAAVAEGRRIAWAYVERRFAAAGYRPGLGIMPAPLLAGGHERARLADSFADAVTAVMLEDALDPADHDDLLGPWASLLP
jgi:hypothetical protein